MRISSPYDGHGRVGLRVVLAGVLAFDLLLVSRFLSEVRPGPASHPHAPAWLLFFAGRSWAIGLVAIVAIVSLVAFARRAAAVLPGWIALASIGLLVEAHAACIEGPYRMLFSGGAAMFGWLVGATYAKDERHAEFGAAAGLAATYVNAFASKTLTGGLGWTDADSLRAVVLTQHHVGGSWLANTYASAVADHAWLAGMLVTLTLIAQASALAYPWHRVTRAASGTLLLAFHANTAILTPLFFPQAMVLLLALSFPWPSIANRIRGRAETQPREDSSSAPIRTTARLVLVGALLVCALVAWASPLRSYTLAHHRHAGSAAPVTPPPVPPSFSAALDGLQPGTRVGDWEVRSLSGAPGGARIDLVSGPLLLHVLVVPHGTVPGDPPASTRRYDVLYETTHPGETPVPATARAEAIDGVARSITSHE